MKDNWLKKLFNMKGTDLNNNEPTKNGPHDETLDALSYLSLTEDEKRAKNKAIAKAEVLALAKEKEEQLLKDLNEKESKELFSDFTKFLKQHTLGYRILKMRDGSTILGSLLINSSTGEPIITNNQITLTAPVELKKQSLGGYGSMQYMEDWITGAESHVPYPISKDDILQVAIPTQTALDSYMVLQNKKAAMKINPKLANLLFSSPIMDNPENYDEEYNDMTEDGEQDPQW
jgi:hypothetical protein